MQQLVDALVTALRERREVVGIWLDGSMGRGAADEYSDVDLGVAVEDERLGPFLEALPDLLRAACHPVLLRMTGRLVNLVTADWLRGDLFVRSASEARGGVPGPVELLHDPLALVHVTTADVPVSPARLAFVIEEFIRCLGLLPIAHARGEWVGSYTATGAMLGLLTELMQIENGNHRIGGALRLTSRLTDEQQRELRALPPLRPDGGAVVAVHLALGRSFLPRARRVAAALGVDYPERLEEALRSHLARAGHELGMSIEGGTP